MKTMNYKIVFSLAILLTFTYSVFSQLPNPGYNKSALRHSSNTAMKHYVPNYLKSKSVRYNMAATASASVKEYSLHFLSKPKNTNVMSPMSPNESVLGHTRYDLQSNGTIQNRLLLNEDGTVAATWTMGFNDPDFPDRGTAYSYFDGAVWSQEPTARIENTRTGWPSISQYGADGEFIVTHNGTTGLEICKRDHKGTGNWTESLFQGPTGSPKLSWPRAVTNGADHKQIHMIAVTTNVSNGGVIYHGMDGALVYSRSLDGGLSWDIKNVQIPGTTVSNYVGFGGDEYQWAEPKGDTLAMIIGSKWFDVFLLKSVDNGTTWTKTMLYEHPYPFYEENHTVVLDTIWVSDGTMAIQLDNEGKANVFFGLMRINNPDTTDGTFNYWYFTDGIAYWKEGDETFTNIETDTLYDQGHLVGWMQDVNGNDTIYEELLDMPSYAFSTTCMPSVTIDNTGDMYLIMSSEMEDHNNGIQSYRHILARKWDHTSGEWGDFFDLTDNIIHNFHECIFPVLSARSNGSIHFMYQADEEPGLAVQGDEDPYGDNFIYYSKVAKFDFVGIPEQEMQVNIEVQNYPNPCTDNTTMKIKIDHPANMSITITDILGRQVFQENLGMKPSGEFSYSLDVKGMLAGLYFYTVIADKQTVTKKMIVQ